MTKQRKVLLALSGFAVVAVAAFAAWYVLLRDDAPPAVNLDDAVAAATSTTVGSGGTVTAATSTTVGSGGTVTTGGTGTTVVEPALLGNWVLDASGNSFVGYRVQEELARIGAATAVGRTTTVTGSLQLEGSMVTAVDIEVDMTRLESDDSRRDGRLETQGIQTASFPTASFSLTTPIDLGQEPAEGLALSTSGVGELTLHGVTNPVEVAIEAQLVDGTIVVIGSMPIAFGDYNISAPTSFAVLSVDDNGIVEFQLLFDPA